MLNHMALFLFLIIFPNLLIAEYKPEWASLDTRPLPRWYDEAKFGIFMHFGVYSVPSYSSAEWFWYQWKDGKHFHETEFMRKNFKPGFSYQDFAPMLTCEFFDGDRFASVIQQSGAKYFVFTSKHHEGFAMWPSKYSWNWNSKDLGPGLDIVGELSTAIRSRGIHFGLYYSLYEWFNPLYLRDKASLFTENTFVEQVVLPQLKELVNAYKPDVLWSDGDWEAPDFYWNSTNFLAWLYNESPVKDKVVVNDRWGKGVMCHHGDFFTCGDRFQPRALQKHKWESCMSVDSLSWGYRRESTLKDYHTIDELIEMLVRTVSCGGNLLLNIGPTHDGRITPIFEERLMQMGDWLSINGESIYSTKPWKYQTELTVPDVWYTSKVKPTYIYPFGNITTVYAILLKWPQSSMLTLPSVSATNDTVITMLGYPHPLSFTVLPFHGLTIDLRRIKHQLLDSKWAWVIKMERID